MLKEVYESLIRKRWELGFVQNGLESIFKEGGMRVDWVKNPFQDRWFADPFILDVTEDYIYVLAEEFQFSSKKGRIAKLFINRKTLVIEKCSIVLELPTHLSFPSILRKDGKVFVYPESCRSGHLDLYEYIEKEEKLEYRQTICDDAVWDSVMTYHDGCPLLFTANKNDFYLDIYKWNPGKSRFLPYRSIVSEKRNSRMAGQLFEYGGETYGPFQNCEKEYGGHIDLKRIEYLPEDIQFSIVRELYSPHKKRRIALHTLNEYKGVVIIDVGGYDYPIIGSFLHRFVRFLRFK